MAHIELQSQDDLATDLLDNLSQTSRRIAIPYLPETVKIINSRVLGCMKFVGGAASLDVLITIIPSNETAQALKGQREQLQEEGLNILDGIGSVYLGIAEHYFDRDVLEARKKRRTDEVAPEIDTACSNSKEYRNDVHSFFGSAHSFFSSLLVASTTSEKNAQGWRVVNLLYLST